MRVNNLGNALLLANISHYLLLPHVDAVTPSQGSLHGGTELTLTGAGLIGVTQIDLGGSLCSLTGLFNTFNCYSQLLTKLQNNHNRIIQATTLCKCINSDPLSHLNSYSSLVCRLAFIYAALIQGY